MRGRFTAIFLSNRAESTRRPCPHCARWKTPPERVPQWGKASWMLPRARSAAASSGAKGVRLTVRQEHGSIAVLVEDDGRGIADDIKSRIFEPLFTTRSRGVGFGLALCRRIAEQHGGHIRAENRPEGGARFEAILPCMPTQTT